MVHEATESDALILKHTSEKYIDIDQIQVNVAVMEEDNSIVITEATFEQLFVSSVEIWTYGE